MAFAVTAVVELLSGSLPMTVTYVSEDSQFATCQWYNPVTGKFEKETFPTELLTESDGVHLSCLYRGLR